MHAAREKEPFICLASKSTGKSRNTFFPPWPYRDYIFKKWIFVKLIGTICWFVRRLIQPTYYELHLTSLDEIWRGMSNYRCPHNMRGPPWQQFPNSYGLAWAAFGSLGSPSLNYCTRRYTVMYQDPFKYDFGLRRYRLQCRAPDSSQLSTPCLTKTIL